MTLPTDKRLGGNLISVRDPLPALLVDQNGAPLIFPAALGQAAAAQSTPVVDATDVWTSPSNVAVSVANTTTALLAAAGATIRKRSTILRNTGDRTVYLGWGASATTAMFPLGVGESFLTKSLLAINGITASGTGTVFVTAEAAS